MLVKEADILAYRIANGKGHGRVHLDTQPGRTVGTSYDDHCGKAEHQVAVFDRVGRQSLSGGAKDEPLHDSGIITGIAKVLYSDPASPRTQVEKRWKNR